MRLVPQGTYYCGGNTFHSLQHSHSYMCGYEDFSNASVVELSLLDDSGCELLLRSGSIFRARRWLRPLYESCDVASLRFRSPQLNSQ